MGHHVWMGWGRVARRARVFLLVLGLALCVGQGVWAATSPTPMTRSFTNSTRIVIGDDGPASPYPSAINVSGMTGVISRVTVTLRSFSHDYPDDVDVLLVTPSNQQLILMSDAGGSFPADLANVTFDDGFPVIPNSGTISSGTYGPANWGLTADVFDAPAPSGPYVVGMTNAIGGNPNGKWSLYVFDDALNNVGTIDLGWSLTITSAELAPTLSVAKTNSLIALTWPTNATGFTLEGASNLGGSWAAVTNSVVTTNGQFQVRVSPEIPARYFRLRK